MSDLILIIFIQYLIMELVSMFPPSVGSDA